MIGTLVHSVKAKTSTAWSCSTSADVLLIRNFYAQSTTQNFCHLKNSLSIDFGVTIFVSRQICNSESANKKDKINKIYLGAKAFVSVTSFNPNKTTPENELQRD